MKIFFRYLFKNKVVTLITFLGLLMGMMGTLFILEYVFYERSFDSYHKNADNIYRIAYNRYNKDGLMWRTANYMCPAGPYLKNTFPEVVDYVTVTRNYDVTITYTDDKQSIISYNEPKTYFATSSIFNVFTITLVSGNNDCIQQPNTVAISEGAAKKYFGNINPVGKTISVNNRQDYTISGIFTNIPGNSHFKTDFLFSLQLSPERLKSWRGDLFHNYLLLKPGTDYKKFYEAAFPRMIKDNYENTLAEYGLRDEVYLQPIRDIHLYSNIEYETEKPGNGKIVTILFWFSLAFLLFAWINYINLVTAQSLERAKEIGIKKISGGNQSKLIFQFISEAFIFNLFCLALALIFFFILNPLFIKWVNINGNISLFSWKFLFFSAVTFFVGIVLSSAYPALIISSFNPVTVLKGKYQNSSDSMFFRKLLVTLQFSVSILLLAGTLISFSQIKYLMGKDSGINCHSKLIIKAPRLNLNSDDYQKKTAAFRDLLSGLPDVVDYTFVSDIPGQDINNFFSCYRKGFNSNDSKAYFKTDIDSSFLKVFGVKLVAGRFFREGDKAEHNYVLINRSGANRLGFNQDEALDKTVISSGAEYTIIGVVDDFNYVSLKIKPVPTFFTLNDNRKKYFCLNFGDQNNISSILAETKKAFNSLYPGCPFDYFFLNDLVNTDIESDKTFTNMFGAFSFLAIIIAVIGVLGLIIITVNRCIKEMGIRKILGADFRNIIRLLSEQFVWQFITALLIALPLSAYGFKKWMLDNYVYHIELNYIHLIIPVVILFFLLLAVIVVMALRVERINPVETLRYE